jgi:hypothetical protein
MSTSAERKVTCSCGREQPVTIYQAINVTLEPALKTRLLAGELNCLACAACGKTSWLHTHLLYHDMAKKLMVQLWAGDRAAVPQVDEQLRKGAASGGGGFTVRIVFSRDELIEKVRAFDDGLDDRALELLKVVIRSQSEAAPDAGPLLFAGIEDLPQGGKGVAFVLRGPQGFLGTTVPLAVYEKVAADVTARLAQLGAAGDVLVVDQAFALRSLVPPSE